MAWISSEYFYQRLMRTQMYVIEQLEQQASPTSETMQKECDAIIDERDELRRWKDAHRNDRKDSATCEGSEDCGRSQKENGRLKSDLTARQAECSRLRTENEEFRLSLEGLKDECREAKSLRDSFDELQVAHEQLKKLNDELEKHLAEVTQDCEFQVQACKELEHSRDDLQDEVDNGKIEPQAHQKTVTNLSQECSLKDNKIAASSSRLEAAWENIQELDQNREDLQSRLDKTRDELLAHVTLSKRAAEYEKDLKELQVEHELVCNMFQDLHDAVAASEWRKREKFLKPWDSFNDDCLKAMLVLLIALGIYGIVTGRLA